MSAENKAVFLSYAREDSEPARRIAEALRAAGIEAWFDQSELRGGDVWDAKIRKQIHDCALFIPIVSAHTQARPEGYFRREWRLAVERTRDMSSNVSFIVPVAIDDLPQADADVPEEFLRYQWATLRGGEATTALVEQVRRLIEGQRRSASPRTDDRGPAFAKAPARPAASTGAEQSTQERPTGLPKWIVPAVIGLLIGFGGFFALRPAKPTPAAASAPAPSSQPVAPGKADVSSKSIAVLPFANLSDDKDASAFFSDGIHEDILTNLTTIRDLRVVSRTSVLGYRGTTKKIADVAKELGVAYVLEGSVRRAGNKVRVTGQLIRAATDEHVWAKNYDRDLTDIFAIQSELSQSIAGELKIVLTPMEQRLLNRRPTENVAAYDLFLKAREARNSPRRNAAFFRQQEEWLSQAVELDPRFASAWAARAWAHGYQVLFGFDRSEARVARAKAAIEKAVELAPDDPYITLERGYYYYFCYRDYERASEIFQQLLRTQPNDAATHYALANVRRRQGKWPEALAAFQRAAQLDPRNTDIASQVALTLVRARRYEEAAASLQRVRVLGTDTLGTEWDEALLPFFRHGSTREMDAFVADLLGRQPVPTQAAAVAKYWAVNLGNPAEVLRLEAASPAGATAYAEAFDVAVALVAKGDAAAARAQAAPVIPELKRRLEAEPGNGRLWSTLARFEAIAGSKDEALAHARKAMELEPESVDASAGLQNRSRLAFVLAWTGDKEGAIAEYARLLKSPTQFDVNIHDMRRSLYYTPLRGDPRFEALLNDPKNNEPLF